MHRDLKPGNILVTVRKGAAEFVKVLDFGIAKLQADQRQTATGMVLGTPLYMAPEQWEGRQDIDGRVDIYALGLILYECLTGQHPFSAKSSLQLMYAHTNQAVPDLAERVPQAPARLRQLVMRMVGKLPTERPASMAEIAAELAQVSAELGGAPLLGSDSQAALSSIAAGPPRPVAATRDPVLSLTADFSTSGMGPPPQARSQVGATESGAAGSIGARPSVPAPSAGRGRRRLALAIGGALLVASGVGFGALSLHSRARPHEPSARSLSRRDVPAEPPRSAAQAPRLIEHGPGRMLIGRPGSGAHADGPPYAVEVERFAIEAYEVSVAQLAEYAEATHNRSLLASAELATGSNRPAVGLTRAQALAYCGWRHAGGRLPTEIEWEYAARDGRSDRLYPWADSDAASLALRANVDNSRGQLDPVDSHPTGASAHGVYNLLGNAAEWTLSDSAAYPGSRASVPHGLAVVRGGSAASPAHGLTATAREFVAPGRSDPFIGFRCATSRK